MQPELTGEGAMAGDFSAHSGAVGPVFFTDTLTRAFWPAVVVGGEAAIPVTERAGPESTVQPVELPPVTASG